MLVEVQGSLSQFLKPPLLRVAPRFEARLRQTCESIIADARGGRATAPASEWLLDNYSYLRTQVREIRESLPLGYYRRLPMAQDGSAPRILRACEAAIAAHLEDLDSEKLFEFFQVWQQHTVLALSELWAIRPILKTALLSRLGETIEEGPLESIETEQTVRQVISALHRLDHVTWAEFVESLCLIDRILRRDPSGDYAAMDFDTRDMYRRAVEEVARYSRHSEQEVAGLAVELATEAKKHVGYFLIGYGAVDLRRAAHARRTASTVVRDLVTAVPTAFYLGAAFLITAGLLIGAREVLPADTPLWFFLLLCIPASQAALTIVNLLISYLLKPTVQPRMDFRNGIPDESRAIVVVPTLLLSESGIQQLINNLEIYFLANRDRNLSFALLTDLADSENKPPEYDPLIDRCVSGIRELNRRYGTPGNEPFFLFHRDREWNQSEGKWMGRERKRGKLDDFNHFLLGERNRFSLTVGKGEQLENTRYVITLDSDTQLPRDTAWKLVGTMAHPLNRPVFDERTETVRSGYALMQPRIGISMESTAKSRFAAFYSGQVGFDPYTKAVSDVYQDLFGRATFTGKGIYDVAAFHRATRDRFPDNTLLSHDLIEGEHVRAGLVTDLEMIDDYPSRYQAFSKRKHRWVRGDWQIAMWLLPRVPDAQWNWKANPLPLAARWKIFDNLRRSLVEISYLLALLAAWLVPAIDARMATLVTAALLLVPVYAELPISLLRLPPLRLFGPWAWTRLSDFRRAHLEAALTLLFLPAQALLMMDAIFRTLYRRVISRRNLLEWESMAQAEMGSSEEFNFARFLNPVATWRSWNMPERYLAAGVVVGAFAWLAIVNWTENASVFPFAVAIIWVASPFLMMWLNSGARTSRQVEQSEFLRGVALSTWRYFVDHDCAEDHWLVPDNVQEDPPAIAHRTSPTNLGLQLNAVLAAHEFGYLTHSEFSERIARLNATLGLMERDRGHFFNWYDTRTLAVLPPRFLSTVDSGNMAASLIVTRQGCLGALQKPLIARNTLASLQDYLQRLRDAVPVSARTSSVVKLMDSLVRQLETDPDDLFFWEGVLTEIRTLADDLHGQVEWAAARLEPRAAHSAQEIRYWLRSFEERVDRALQSLSGLAPWLCQPFETELRMNINNARLSGLMTQLRRVPSLSKLSSIYASVEREIEHVERAQGQVHGSTLKILRDLRPVLQTARSNWEKLERELRSNAEFANQLYDQMDFRFLVDERRQLLRIGWDSDAGALASSSYDLLASEARTAVFLAVARGDAPLEAWFQLGRKLTYYRGHRTLISWSGTMFEYLMPALFMQTWEGTLLGESLQSVVRIQRVYARERRIPWGISESAHSGRDGALNYQYRAFGVPCCGADRINRDDLVIAPYASVLSLMVDPNAATTNLRQMASRGWLGRFGFYEAVDYRRRSRGKRKVEVIRAFMAHHQGMSFLALANVLLDNPIQKLFHSAPSVMATELLLQERMPAMVQAEPPEEPLPGLEAAPLQEPLTGGADDLVARLSV